MSCPFCESDRVVAVPVRRQYVLRAIGATVATSFSGCESCGGVWQATPASAEILSAYYQSNAHFRDAEPDAASIRVMNEQIDFFAHGLDIANKDVLEYGADAGHLLELLRSRTSCRTHFDELNERCAERLAGRGHTARSEGRTYDGVLMFHLLEHVPDPAAFLRTVRRSIKPDGFLAIEVPDHSIWDERTTTDNFEHLSYFSAPAMSALLARTGFTIDRLETSFNEDYASFNRRALRVRARPTAGNLSQSAARHFNDVIDARRAGLERLVQSGTSIGVYGIGMLTDLLLSDSPLTPQHVTAFFDGDKSKHGSAYFGGTVLPPAEAGRVDTMLIVSSAESAIRKGLSELGYKGRVIGLNDLLEGGHK